MTKVITKLAFTVCLLALVCVPIAVWAITGRMLSDIATFVAACASERRRRWSAPCPCGDYTLYSPHIMR